MSKYRIHIENIGEGADWDGSTIECEGFAIIGNITEDECSTTLQDVSTGGAGCHDRQRRETARRRPDRPGDV